MNKRLILICLIILCSCSKEHNTVTFVSQSLVKIDSVQIVYSEHCPIVTLKNIIRNKPQVADLIPCDKTTGDGCCGIKIYRNGKVIRHQGYGYYSNGGSPLSDFRITFNTLENLIVEDEGDYSY